MKLKMWLLIQKRSMTSLAKEINYSLNYISRVCNGFVKPGRKFVELIEKATNGEIKAQDLGVDPEELKAEC